MSFSFSPFPSLTTSRLHLRETLESDLEQVFHLRSDPAINRFIQRDLLVDLEEARKIFNTIDGQRHRGECVDWAICYREDPKMIGSICLWNFSADHEKGEIGYALATEHQHQGLMSEAMECVLNYGFNQLNLQRIEAFTHGRNTSSIALLRKHGFKEQSHRNNPENKNDVVFLCLPG